MFLPTHRRGYGFHRHLFRMSVFPHDISETDAAKFTKRDVQIFHDES